jgi:TatD DNase family protein
MDDHNIAAAASAATRPAPLIDIGINLAHDSYAADRAAVLSRAHAAGVVQLIVTGSSLDSTARAIELARAHPGQLFGTAGIHPHHAAAVNAEAWEALAAQAAAREVVAIGECGLDYFRNYSPPAAQQAAFHRQLELARALGKPVFLHQREAHADFLAILREHAAQWRGVAHCFTGTAEALHAYLDLGLAIGITGWINDERRGSHLVPLMPQIPASRLLLETDGPYLLPRDLQPKPASRRNEPAYLAHIARAVARARGEPPEALARSSTQAARALFGLPDSA